MRTPRHSKPHTRPLVTEFLGAVHAWPSHLEAMHDIGLGWTRLDVPWSGIQPSPDAPPDLTRALRHGNLAESFAQLAAENITLLPILSYGTDWAAVSPPYIYYSRGLRYEIRTDPNSPNALVRLVFDPATEAEIACGPFTHLDMLPPADVADWRAYCEHVVATLAGPPYSLTYSHAHLNPHLP